MKQIRPFGLGLMFFARFVSLRLQPKLAHISHPPPPKPKILATFLDILCYVSI